MPRKAARIGVRALVPQYVDENAITAFGMKPVDSLVENCVVIHGMLTPVQRCHRSISSPIIAGKQKIQRERLATSVVPLSPMRYFRSE
jgi:hypothetical protein